MGDGGSGSSSGTGDTTNTTMQATTMQATTEPMTSGMTTVGPDDTTTTGSVDSSGSITEGSSSGSTGPAEGSSSSGAPPMDPAYPACMNVDPPCPEPYDHCYTGLQQGSGFSVCSVMCMDDAECPLPDGGDAVPACAGPMMNECVLDCGGGATCPDGMECVEVVMGIERCAWPD